MPAWRLCPPVVVSGRRDTRTLAGQGRRRARHVDVSCGRLAQRPGCRCQGRRGRHGHIAGRHRHGHRRRVVDPLPVPQVDCQLRPVGADADGRCRHHQLGDGPLRQLFRRGWRRCRRPGRTRIRNEADLKSQTQRNAGVTECALVEFDVTCGRGRCRPTTKTPRQGPQRSSMGTGRRWTRQHRCRHLPLSSGWLLPGLAWSPWSPCCSPPRDSQPLLCIRHRSPRH